MLSPRAIGDTTNLRELPPLSRWRGGGRSIKFVKDRERRTGWPPPFRLGCGRRLVGEDRSGPPVESSFSWSDGGLSARSPSTYSVAPSCTRRRYAPEHLEERTHREGLARRVQAEKIAS